VDRKAHNSARTTVKALQNRKRKEKLCSEKQTKMTAAFNFEPIDMALALQELGKEEVEVSGPNVLGRPSQDDLNKVRKLAARQTFLIQSGQDVPDGLAEELRNALLVIGQDMRDLGLKETVELFLARPALFLADEFVHEDVLKEFEGHVELLRLFAQHNKNVYRELAGNVENKRPRLHEALSDDDTNKVAMTEFYTKEAKFFSWACERVREVAEATGADLANMDTE